MQYKEQFNDLIGDSVQFWGTGGHTYEIEVKKGPTRTRLGGEGWRQFIAHHRLIRDGELVCFGLMDGVSTITVIYLNNNGGEEEEEEDEEEEEPPLSPLISQRCKLTAGENEHLQRIIPPSNFFVGVPFVTRLTRTNVKRHLMVHTDTYTYIISSDPIFTYLMIMVL